MPFQSEAVLHRQSYHMLIAQTEAEELPSVSVNPYFSFGPVTKAVSEMKQHLNEFSNDEQVKVATTSECGARSVCLNSALSRWTDSERMITATIVTLYFFYS